MPQQEEKTVLLTLPDRGDLLERACRAAAATRSDLREAAERGEAGGAALLARRRILRALAARCWGLHPDLVSLERLGAGGLRVLGPRRSGHASASYRPGILALALSDRPIGVDVEALGNAGLVPPHPAEPVDPAERLRLFSLREALSKATGTGLAFALACPLRWRGPGRALFGQTASLAYQGEEGSWVVTLALADDQATERAITGA